MIQMETDNPICRHLRHHYLKIVDTGTRKLGEREGIAVEIEHSQHRNGGFKETQVITLPEKVAKELTGLTEAHNSAMDAVTADTPMPSPELENVFKTNEGLPLLLQASHPLTCVRNYPSPSVEAGILNLLQNVDDKLTNLD